MERPRAEGTACKWMVAYKGTGGWQREEQDEGAPLATPQAMGFVPGVFAPAASPAVSSMSPFPQGLCKLKFCGPAALVRVLMSER